MNYTIWKYEISPYNPIIKMPKEAEILSIKTQNGLPCIWALVNKDMPEEERYFEIFGTGHRVPVDMGIDRKFIGTVLLENDNLVFHVFERFGI